MNPMGSVLALVPKVVLEDEFADFEIREELEQELERRLQEADLDARPALKDFEPTADEDQLSLIQSSGHQTIRLVAPAESGKTQTLIHRVLHQTKHGTRPDRVLCLTFDNAAGKALRDKIAEQVAALHIDHNTFQITTLNAFGYKLLRENFPPEYKPIIEPNRVWRLIKEVRERLVEARGGRERNDAIPDTLRYRFFAEYFSFLKNALFDPRSISAQPLAEFMLKDRTSEVFFQANSTNEQKRLVIQAVIWIYQQYDLALQRNSRIDFDDQKLRALKSLEQAPSTLELIQRRYDEVIVDEFQDINQLDFALISAIAKQARLIVTGDDDQAIYGFRGCSPSYIIDLEKHSGREVKSFELRRNYRCPKNVVEHATRLIRNNTWRIEKNPVAVRPDDATIKVVESTTATAEAKMIATTIERIKRRNENLQYHDFAVLYRTNAQSLPIQLQFILRDIPYMVREQDNILENEELEKLLGAAREARDRAR
jgi:DNA helicase-2/ATP-dependent DNA helicase PcrA